MRWGSTTMLRTITQQREGKRELIRAYGGLARVGAVATSGAGADQWAHFVGMLEWGWASGDSDPYDGTYRRFDFNPNHNVGLVLFEQVLGWLFLGGFVALLVTFFWGWMALDAWMRTKRLRYGLLVLISTPVGAALYFFAVYLRRRFMHREE